MNVQKKTILDWRFFGNLILFYDTSGAREPNNRDKGN